MLVVVFKNGRQEDWHINDTLKPMERLRRRLNSLDEVSMSRLEVEHLNDLHILQADGDELAHIQVLFVGTVGSSKPIYTIPMPKANVCNWFGDTARTIYMNL